MSTSVPQRSDVSSAITRQPEGAGPFSRLPASLSPELSLLHYYALSSLLLGPAFLFALVPRFFRFRTMRYEVDDEGITMRWGLLFRREISLTYARIQDIHLSSNFVERWLGLARIQVQTASGSAKAELTIEGLPHAPAIRDFLYSRMRGARDLHAAAGPDGATSLGEHALAELTETLREVAAEIRGLREALPAREEAPHG
ncbi:MAG: PH domain-containing protein [Gemmatimonadota bacterium]